MAKRQDRERVNTKQTEIESVHDKFLGHSKHLMLIMNHRKQKQFHKNKMLCCHFI